MLWFESHKTFVTTPLWEVFQLNSFYVKQVWVAWRLLSLGVRAAVLMLSGAELLKATVAGLLLQLR